MKIVSTFFDSKVILCKYDILRDNRGYFAEIYNKRALNKVGIKSNFVQDNQSLSKNKYTFRGIHCQLNPFRQAKLIRVVHGSIIDFIVDLRIRSKTFGKNIQIKLNNNKILFIPEGFGHGFLTLEKNTLINYKVSKFYSKDNSKTILFNDKDIKLKINKNIIKKMILSKNDKFGLSLKELYTKYKKKL